MPIFAMKMVDCTMVLTYEYHKGEAPLDGVILTSSSLRDNFVGEQADVYYSFISFTGRTQAFLDNITGPRATYSCLTNMSSAIKTTAMSLNVVRIETMEVQDLWKTHERAFRYSANTWLISRYGRHTRNLNSGRH